MAFPSIFLHGSKLAKLQESWVLRRRLHAKETTDIVNEFFKSSLERKGKTNSCACVTLFLLKLAQRERFTAQIQKSEFSGQKSN